MEGNNSTFGAFAHHYRTGRYTDLRLISKDVKQFDVHKLVVCSQSPVLDAVEDASAVNINHEAHTVEQMVEWMYGIDDKKLLIEGKNVDEVMAMGSSVVYGEILTLTDLAKIAEEYELPKLKDQAKQLIDQLTETFNSTDDILTAVLQLAPSGVVGAVQKALTSRALHLSQTERRPTTLADPPSAPRDRKKLPSRLPPPMQRTSSPTRSSSSSSEPIAKKQRRKRNDPSRISTALPSNDPHQGPHCHCHAAWTDPTLLPCAECGKLFHPRCVGKGRFAQGTYSSDPVGYMKKDVDAFADREFKCGGCEAGFFGVK